MGRNYGSMALGLALCLLLLGTGCNFQVHSIPLHVIALSDDDGSRGNTITPAEFAAVVEDMNDLYQPAGIQFTFDASSDWEERWDTDLNSMQNGGTGWWELPNEVAWHYPGKLVVYLRWGPNQQIAGNGFAYPPDTGQAIPASAPLPVDNVDFIAMLNQPNLLSAGFLAHEIGHYLGLFHTHPTWGGDAANIQPILDALGATGLDGDGLDDTPPDGAPNHYMANSGAGSACAGTGVYQAPSAATISGTALIAPARQNIMSYFRCGDIEFSFQQVLVMRMTLEHDFRRHLIEPVCMQDHHRYPVEDWQRCVEYWALKGHWPVTVSAADMGKIVMTSSIQKGSPTYVRHLVDSDRYQETAEDAEDDGYRPEQVQGVLIEGQPRWSAVWTKINGNFSSRHGVPVETFAQSWTDMTDKGWQLVDFNVMDDWDDPGSDTPRFNFTWEDQGSMDFIAHYDMTDADYQALFWDYDDDGYEVVRFNSYSTPNGKRYAALWHPQKMDYAHIPWQSANTYQTNAELYAQSGFRIRQLHDYDGLISAIWIREPREGNPNDPDDPTHGGGDPNDPTRGDGGSSHPPDPGYPNDEPEHRSASDASTGEVIRQTFGDVSMGSWRPAM